MCDIRPNEEQILERLVGKVNQDELQFVDYYLTEEMGLFMPLGGPCHYAIQEHSHPGWMFVLAFDDKTELFINGQCHRSKPQVLCMLAPNVPHKERTLSDKPRYIAVFISPEYMEYQRKLFDPQLDLGHFAVNDKGSSEICDISRRIISELSQNKKGKAAVLEALQTELCQTVLRNLFCDRDSNEIPATRPDLNHIIGKVYHQLDEPILVEKLAKSLGYSESSLKRLMKKETGTSPKKYVQNLKLQAAKRLLQRTSRPISDIALECGFSTPSHLSTQFKRHYHETPLEYRNRLS
ncbi:MAG: helix-turn-helix transcriptional regulator [Spirochaetota bacterium]|nr:helix-turn-helix transcriptional regulator [Spirochaetota bacterium]